MVKGRDQGTKTNRMEMRLDIIPAYHVIAPGHSSPIPDLYGVAYT